MEVDYQLLEENIRAGYRRITAQYRRDDEIEVTTENHCRLGRLLRRICQSFPKRIAALDVGCGTGRYFHCLEKVEHLTGLDISEEMLAAARNPVRKEWITAGTIKLRQGNIYFSAFPPHSFDLIYSLGMFGHGCPVTVQICGRFFEWLKPGGKLLFNVVDVAGLPWCQRLGRRLRSVLCPLLSARWRCRLDVRERRSPLFALRRRQLLRLLAETHFQRYSVLSQPCSSPLWNGRHLECLAHKD